MELTNSELRIIERGLIREHNTALDKRRKMQPSVRAIWLADTDRVLAKVRAEMVRREEANEHRSERDHQSGQGD